MIYVAGAELASRTVLPPGPHALDPSGTGTAPLTVTATSEQPSKAPEGPKDGGTAIAVTRGTGQGRAEPPSRAVGSPRKITHGLRTHSPHSFPSLELVLKSCQKITHDLSMTLGKCLRLPNVSACGTKAAPTAAAQGGFLLSLVRMQPNLSKVRHRVGTQLGYGGFGAAGSHHSQPGGAVQG